MRSNGRSSTAGPAARWSWRRPSAASPRKRSRRLVTAPSARCGRPTPTCGSVPAPRRRHRAVKASESSYEDSLRSYRLGLSTLIDLLAARRELSRARFMEVDTKLSSWIPRRLSRSPRARRRRHRARQERVESMSGRAARSYLIGSFLSLAGPRSPVPPRPRLPAVPIFRPGCCLVIGADASAALHPRGVDPISARERSSIRACDSRHPRPLGGVFRS